MSVNRKRIELMPERGHYWVDCAACGERLGQVPHGEPETNLAGHAATMLDGRLQMHHYSPVQCIAALQERISSLENWLEAMNDY